MPNLKGRPPVPGGLVCKYCGKVGPLAPTRDMARKRALVAGWSMVKDYRYVRCDECRKTRKHGGKRIGKQMNLKVPDAMFWQVQDVMVRQKLPSMAATIRFILSDYFDDDFPWRTGDE